jgi:hypothetical protein
VVLCQHNTQSSSGSEITGTSRRVDELCCTLLRDKSCISGRGLILESVYKLLVTKFMRYIDFPFKFHICYKMCNCLAFYRMTSRRNAKN